MRAFSVVPAPPECEHKGEPLYAPRELHKVDLDAVCPSALLAAGKYKAVVRDALRARGNRG